MSEYMLHAHIYTTCQSLDTPYVFMTIEFITPFICKFFKVATLFSMCFCVIADISLICLTSSWSMCKIESTKDKENALRSIVCPNF